jgi:hypothetical protein
MTADACHYRAEPARPLIVQAREASPFTRKSRRITAQANTARPCTVARVVTNTTKRSDEAVALRRRSARMCRIDRLHSMAEMFQNPLDDCGFLDAGDHQQLPAAEDA